MFYSSLTGYKNSDNEYEHVLKIWNTFTMKTMKYYQELKFDVLLVVDVFKKFKNCILKNY